MSLFGSIFKYVWPQMRKYKGAFYTIVSIFTIRVIIDAIMRPFYFKKLIDILSKYGVDPSSIKYEAFKIVLIIVLINLILFIIARSIKFLFFSFEINVMKELRNFSFEKIQNQSQTFFANKFSGSLVTKSRRFVGSFETMFDIFIYSFLNFFVTIVGVFVVLFFQARNISLVFLIWIIIHISVVSFFIKKKIKYDILEANQDSKISGRLADVFGNILAVKFFSSHKKEFESFKEYTDEGVKRSKKAWFWGGRIDMIQHAFVIIVNTIILFITVSMWLKGNMTTGTVVLVQTYMIIISEKLWDLGNSMTKFMKSASDMKEMIDLFEIKPDILDPNNPEKLKVKDGNISFNNVSFIYKNGQQVFENFNLNIKSGERVGLVGHSGAGKSTLTNLILRFVDVTSGSITIDDQDIRNVTQDDLRSIISYVPQESVLFHRTIKENISYSKIDATDEEIKEVSRKAYAHEFIEKLPYGYETYVGERGVKLSGGERQRVAIARAMLKDAPVLILDEATSSLDSISEQYIQKAFDELMKGKTTIVIAHRLSTIQKMDRIIVLDNGKIAEEGTHKELLEKGGMYADLWNHQVGGFIE